MLEGDRDQLRNLEERNANLERDVRRYEERRQIERDVCEGPLSEGCKLTYLIG